MDFFVALLLAALSGMGVGGGGLFALWLSLTTQMEQIRIQALNLIFFLFSSGAALTVHLRHRRIFPLAIAIAFVFGLLGSYLGSTLALFINGAVLGKIFGSVMIIAGAYSMIKSFK